ncbi:MAG: Ribosomal-protein-alanine acetyltransferase [candidate division TM6 bacterium GW2011_GWF2_43_17]|nr:MAG: Ribosomal-protein-alanine acetyltransferase [candidate division TM6 bacterium GW2011_GWF2_43_17]
MLNYKKNIIRQNAVFLLALGAANITCGNRTLPCQISELERKTGDLKACIQICASPKNRTHVCPGLNLTEIDKTFKNFLPPKMLLAKTSDKTGPITQVFVAKVKKNIIGLAIYNKKNSTVHCIYGLAVHENYHRRGIGTQILEHLKKIADTNKASISLMVHENNTPAISLYTKHMFKKESCFSSYHEYRYNGQK